MYTRLLASALERGTRSVLLLGPRQVGKSTLLRGLRPDLTLNLTEPAAFRRYVAAPELLAAELLAAPSRLTVLLDEVQRVPALLDVVQVLLDDHPGRFRFLLSGSSARKLRRGEANLLPGRVLSYALHPLVAAEHSDFTMARAMAEGALPGVCAEPDPQVRAQILRSYADTYLREEIQAEALVRNVGGYARLLELVAAASGHVLNIAALCGDAGLRQDSARRYLQVLIDTLVAFEVPAWRGADRAGLVAHPRIYLFDVGVRNALLRRPLDAPSPDERGVLLEHLVAYEVVRRASVWPDARLFYFRTRHGAEVDFVVDTGSELWGIEVKASSNLDRVRRAGFTALEDRAGPLARRLVVYLGERPAVVGDIEVLPFLDFARSLPSVA